MKKITRNELKEILEEHKKWLYENGGKQADLRYADLSNADLSNADLSNANLWNANLSGTDLRYADLRYAYLSNADLRYADLWNANLSGTDLSDANLSGTDLRYCNTEHLKGKNVISVQINTSRENNKISYWEDLGVWTTGCFQGTLEELKESIERTHKDNEFLRKRYERAIEYILKEVEVEDGI